MRLACWRLIICQQFRVNVLRTVEPARIASPVLLRIGISRNSQRLISVLELLDF